MKKRRRRICRLRLNDEIVGFEMTTGFAAGEEQWRARQGTLRQVVRQELVSRQLAAHLTDEPARRVLDLGCGQGTQLLYLARRGHLVTGLDSSASMLADLRLALSSEPPEVSERVRLVQADAARMLEVLPESSFDVVLCHGVLMYFADPEPLLDAMAAVMAPAGTLSLLVRNGDALAMRPGLLGDWEATAAALDDVSYRNRLGLQARADHVDALTASLTRRGLSILSWYGVRVFTDIVADDAPPPDSQQLLQVIACEERAGRTDPYRRVAALLHIIAMTPAAGTA